VRLQGAAEHVSHSIAEGVDVGRHDRDVLRFAQLNEVAEKLTQAPALGVQLGQGGHNRLIVAKQADRFPRQAIAQKGQSQVHSSQFFDIDVVCGPVSRPTIGNEQLACLII
jgi:hypothetical protein